MADEHLSEAIRRARHLMSFTRYKRPNGRFVYHFEDWFPDLRYLDATPQAHDGAIKERLTELSRLLDEGMGEAVRCALSLETRFELNSQDKWTAVGDLLRNNLGYESHRRHEKGPGLDLMQVFAQAILDNDSPITEPTSEVDDIRTSVAEVYLMMLLGGSVYERPNADYTWASLQAFSNFLQHPGLERDVLVEFDERPIEWSLFFIPGDDMPIKFPLIPPRYDSLLELATMGLGEENLEAFIGAIRVGALGDEVFEWWNEWLHLCRCDWDKCIQEADSGTWPSFCRFHHTMLTFHVHGVGFLDELYESEIGMFGQLRAIWPPGLVPLRDVRVIARMYEHLVTGGPARELVVGSWVANDESLRQSEGPEDVSSGP